MVTEGETIRSKEAEIVHDWVLIRLCSLMLLAISVISFFGFLNAESVIPLTDLRNGEFVSINQADINRMNILGLFIASGAFSYILFDMSKGRRREENS